MVIGSNILAGSSGQGGGYNISRSLRFRASATAYLSRTPASSGTRTTWTWSDWIKRGSLGSFKTIFTTNDAVNNSTEFYFNTDDTIKFREYASSAGGYTAELYTTQVFRDPSAWYHVMLVWDSNNGTSSDRLRLYINGVRVTSFSTSNYPTSGRQTFFNSAYLTTIGVNSSSSTFDGYRTEVNFIDGQALTPSSFGETSTTTGVWIPKKYSGTYGTNGFYLPFSDNTSTTTLGADSSGNGNNWTCNNISLTTGSTYDSMTDVPTLTSATASNFATFNPLVNSTGTYSATPTYSQANLLATGTADTKQYYSESTIYFSSGKFYSEFTPSAVTGNASYVGIGTENLYLYAPDGQYYNNGSWGAYGATYTTNDVIGVAVDATTGTIEFYKNGTSQGQKTIATGKTWVFRTSSYNTGASHSWTANFGQRQFAYTPPTGFVALNTYNLPTPTIGATASSQANKYFDATTYTGNGSTNTITNSGSMKPDMVWLKPRSIADSHNLYDSVRGISGTGSPLLSTDSTSAEATYTGFGVSALNSNGFTLIGNGGLSNSNGQNYVGWQWRANGGTNVTNTVGSITSTVSANTTSGFSVVTFTGTGVGGATIGHGLGVTPKMVIVKTRSGVADWCVYHTSTGATKGIYLNQTSAAITSSAFWNDTAPSSTVFTLGGGVVGNGVTAVAYCFSEVAGFSKFGSYTGNGSSDGTFVYTGFRPKYVMIKRTDSSDDWILLDTSRSTYNVSSLTLYANGSYAEDSNVTNRSLDFLSNGFKIRSSGVYINASGGNFVYACFSENPFKYSLAR